MIGADANGFDVATNAIALPRAGSKGRKIYAISLTTLESTSGGSISAVHFGNIDVVPGEPARSVQPATTPPGGSFESAAAGTEYFVSALPGSHG